MSDGNGDLLPHEIWSEIFIRLPVKSILRCRSVCKSWYSLISDPSFISDHQLRNHLNNSSNHVLLKLKHRHKDDSQWSFSSRDDESFVESCEHDDFPEPFRGRDLCIVGSCNGLICLSKFDHPAPLSDEPKTVTFLVWNPTVRKTAEVPPRTFPSCHYRASFSGFGFDPNTREYKVLLIFEGRLCDCVTWVCEVFDLRKGVWRRINPTMHPMMREWILHLDSICYLDGSIHWIHSIADIDGRISCILMSFNMSDEVFQEIGLPDRSELFVRDRECMKIKTVAFNGLIYLILMNKGKGEQIDMLWSFSVWAMKEYGVTESWTKVSTIDVSNTIGFLRNAYLHDFYVWGNDEIIMVDDRVPNRGFKHIQDLVLYIGEGKKHKVLSSYTKQIWSLCFYKESLVLM